MPNPSAPKPGQATTEVEFRRAPKLLPFAITGAVLGLLAAIVLYQLIPAANRSSENIYGLLLITLGSAGLGLGVLTAIIIDLITSRRVRQLNAQRITSDAGDELGNKGDR